MVRAAFGAFGSLKVGAFRGSKQRFQAMDLAPGFRAMLRGLSRGERQVLRRCLEDMEGEPLKQVTVSCLSTPSVTFSRTAS